MCKVYPGKKQPLRQHIVNGTATLACTVLLRISDECPNFSDHSFTYKRQIMNMNLHLGSISKVWKPVSSPWLIWNIFSVTYSSSFLLNKIYWHAFLKCIPQPTAHSWFKLHPDVGKICSVELFLFICPPCWCEEIFTPFLYVKCETNLPDVERLFKMLNMSYGVDNSVLHQYLLLIDLY